MTGKPQREHISTVIGVDLGGARGKSTALALLRLAPEGGFIETVMTRTHSEAPWTDDALLDYLQRHASPTHSVVAISAPLTQTACLRCVRPSCPGYKACPDPATEWLRDQGEAMRRHFMDSNTERIASIPPHSRASTESAETPEVDRPIPPYSRRCTEVLHHYQEHRVSRDHLGQANGPIGARGVHLRLLLAHRGFALNESLIEVSARGAIHALFGSDVASGYKRDADPWHTRAKILERLAEDLKFHPASGLAREGVLQSDHAFDALIAAYCGYLWARDAWTMPEGLPWTEDGWLWMPPSAR